MSVSNYFDDVDNVVYVEDVDDRAAICERDVIGVFTTLLAAKLTELSLAKGIRVVFDVEPTLYESALAAYGIVASCAKYWLTEETVVLEGSDGKSYTVDFSIFAKAQPAPGTVLFVIMQERNPEKMSEDLEDLVVSPHLAYVYVTRGLPDAQVSVAVYDRGVIPSVLRLTFTVMHERTGDPGWLEKRRLIGRVPHDVLLQVDADTARAIAATWTPPPPPHSDYLRKRVRRIDELILPDSLRAELTRFVEVARADGRGSLLLVGLPASGRKTIARALAAELGLPSYHLSIANILSRWVGESESKLRAFFEGLRGRGGLAVFENVEALFRRNTGEGVTSNLRSILFQEMARDDNNFIIVFTSYEDAQPEVFDSPLIGETKLVVPPPDKEERRALARAFLPEIAGEDWDRLLGVLRERMRVPEAKAAEVAYTMYADPIAGAATGMTSGELYRAMRRILIPAIKRTLETGTPADITDDVIRLTKRDYTTRQAKLGELLQRAVLLGHVDIADAILRVREEVRAKAIQVSKILEKYKAT